MIMPAICIIVPYAFFAFAVWMQKKRRDAEQ